MDRTAVLIMAVERALRAPSVHNTQPWRWRIDDDAVQLHADWTRHLVATDPDRRDLVLSCGAALHHLLVALAARGREAQVDRLPDPDDTGHLATVTLRPGAGLPADAALQRAIDRRRTDRRRMSHRPVPPEHLRLLEEHARRAGALLIPVSGPAMRQRLGAALADAAARQDWIPGYPAELELWTRRYAGARDGVPASSIAPPLVGAVGAAPLRRFPRGRLDQPQREPGRKPGSTLPSCSSSARQMTTSPTGCGPARRPAPCCWPPRRSGSPRPRSARASSSTPPGAPSSATSYRFPKTRSSCCASGGPRPGRRKSPPTPRRDLRSVLITG